MDLSINTPALLFPAITLLMLAYTNRFLALASLVRSLHSEYKNQQGNVNLHRQIQNLHTRIRLIRNMQALGVLSFLLCVICMYLIFATHFVAANWVFAGSLLSLLISLIISLAEIILSTKAIDIVLSDVKLTKLGFFKTLFDQEEKKS